jgi:WD40 repeat protein
VAITPDGRYAISGFYDGTIKVWDLQTGAFLRMISGPEPYGSAVAITSAGKNVVPDWSQVRDPCVSALAVTPDGRRAISGSRDSTGELRLWDLRTGKLCVLLSGHDDGVTALAVITDGRHVLSASRDRTLRLWDLEMCVCRALVPLESAPQAIAVAADGRTVVVGDRVGNIHHFVIHGK